MKKLTVFLITMLVLVSVYGFRMPKPKEILEFNESSLVAINETFELIWYILNGRYSEFAEDITFESGAGLMFGEINVKDSSATTTLNSDAIVQLTIFDTNGESNNTTPDHTNDHIEIATAGIYLVTVSIHVNNEAAQSHVIHASLYKNNGATELENVHSHRSLSGGSGDVGSISMSGIVSLSVNDTVEIWATTDAAGDRSVTFSDATLSIVMIGG